MNRMRTQRIGLIALLAVAIVIGVANYSLAAPASHPLHHHKPTLAQQIAAAVASYLRKHV